MQDATADAPNKVPAAVFRRIGGGGDVNRRACEEAERLEAFDHLRCGMERGGLSLRSAAKLISDDPVAKRPVRFFLYEMIDKPLDKPVGDAIAAVVRHAMTRFGLRHVKAVAEADQDGDPVIFVDVDHGGDAREVVDVKATASLVTKLRDKLWTMGETRFPHTRHHFAAEQKVVGF